VAISVLLFADTNMWVPAPSQAHFMKDLALQLSVSVALEFVEPAVDVHPARLVGDDWVRSEELSEELPVCGPTVAEHLPAKSQKGLVLQQLGRDSLGVPVADVGAHVLAPGLGVVDEEEAAQGVVDIGLVSHRPVKGDVPGDAVTDDLNGLLLSKLGLVLSAVAL